ncbi:MAG TPA: porin family protein [Sulfuricurvum sp.]|nr:porin family protein [Sulfuricurvum sp.]
MRRSFLLCLVMATLAFNTQAEELHHTKLGVHTGPYFEPKLIMTLGDTISHGESTLSGDTGYGIGYDLGYSFTENFALELDGTYSKSDVKETDSIGDTQTDRASFYTYGVNAALSYPLHKHFIILGKLGYGYEHEDLGKLGIKGSDHGANWTAGVEYSFNPHVEVSFEYEGSEIKSARGDSLQLGLIYKF